MGHAKLAVLISRNWYGRYRCRFGGLLVPPAPLPLTTARVGAGTLVVFGDYQIAPIAARSTTMGRCARWAQDIIACDTAERIIFTIVAGSGSGKLCWHSRGTDNDQENAGYVRESAGGSEQALRAEEVQKRSFCRCFWLLLSPQTKVARAGARNYPRRRQILRLRRCAATPHPPPSGASVSLRVGRFAGLTRHRPVIQYRGPLKGKA